VREARERLQAACDSSSMGWDGTGLRPLWGSVGDTWFRVRAIRVRSLVPAAEGRLLPDGTGSRVTVSADADPEGARFAWQLAWYVPVGVLSLVLGLTAPTGRVPALLVGGMFLIGAWAFRRWLVNSARRTRQVLTDVLMGPPPPPAKWRPKLPERRAP
jgi:hypothetical protein